MKIKLMQTTIVALIFRVLIYSVLVNLFGWNITFLALGIDILSKIDQL